MSLPKFIILAIAILPIALCVAIRDAIVDGWRYLTGWEDPL
jgi:hypothetical protein